MDITVMTQVLSQLGFPVAACVALFWMLHHEQELHREETLALKQSIDSNTAMIQELRDYLRELK